MRRSDREVTGLGNILAVLDKCEVIRIGLCFENRPYIVPMNFGYEMKDGRVFIYMHSAREGKKIDMIARNDNVCFEADCGYQLLKSENACRYTSKYQSVMGEGKMSILTDAGLKTAALDVIMKRYGFEGRPFYEPQALDAVAVLQLAVTALTGKIR